MFLSIVILIFCCFEALFFSLLNIFQSKISDIIEISLTKTEKYVYTIYFCFLLPVFGILVIIGDKIDLLIVPRLPQLVINIIFSLLLIDFVNFAFSIISLPRFISLLYGRLWIHMTIHLIVLISLNFEKMALLYYLFPSLYSFYTILMIQHIPGIIIINKDRLKFEKFRTTHL